jgi:hypothetical protein
LGPDNRSRAVAHDRVIVDDRNADQ